MIGKNENHECLDEGMMEEIVRKGEAQKIEMIFKRVNNCPLCQRKLANIIIELQ